MRRDRDGCKVPSQWPLHASPCNYFLQAQSYSGLTSMAPKEIDGRQLEDQIYHSLVAIIFTRRIPFPSRGRHNVGDEHRVASWNIRTPAKV